MQFTGRNLELVRRALDLADSELHNQIATCPHPDEYEEALEDLEAEQREVRRLMARIDKHLERKGT